MAKKKLIGDLVPRHTDKALQTTGHYFSIAVPTCRDIWKRMLLQGHLWAAFASYAPGM